MKATLTEDRMHQQALQIHQILSRYGYPGVINRPIPKSAQASFSSLSDYFQPTTQRTHLLQWLILQLDPCYQYHKGEEVKLGLNAIIVRALWRLGVMPLSKHTRNLDYEKYVFGLLGEEKAVSLLHELCRLLQEVNRGYKSKEDRVFGDFFGDAVKNYTSLVEVNHDPYQISFPPAYNQFSNEQFEQEWANCQERIEQLEGRQVDKQVGPNFEDAMVCFERNKVEFKAQYEALVSKIQQTLQSNQHLVLQGCKHQQEQPSSRLLQVKPSLSAKYAAYKKKIAINKAGADSLSKRRGQIEQSIRRMNDEVLL